MLQFTKTDKVDVSTYKERLSSNDFIYVNKKSTQDAIKDLAVREETFMRLSKEYMSDHGRPGCNLLTSDYIRGYLISQFNIPESRFMVRDKNNGGYKYSLDSKKILQPLMVESRASEFLEYFTTYKSLKSKKSRMVILDKEWLSDVVGQNDEGEDLYALRYQTAEQDNLRFYPHSYNVIGINKEHSYIIEAPKDKVIVSGDFPQADLKTALNLMLISNEEDRKFFEKYSDSYEALARMSHAHNIGLLCEDYIERYDSTAEDIDLEIYYLKYIHSDEKMVDRLTRKNSLLIAKHNGIQNVPSSYDFNLEYFTENRRVFKVNCLSPLNGAVSAKTSEARTIIDELNRFYDSKPKYKEFKRRIEARINTNLPIPVKTYFGYENVVPLQGFSDSSGKKYSPFNKALNAPFQTGTSELIILTANAVLDRFIKLGYKEGEDIKLLFTRHDEPIFMIDKKVMKDSWVFGDCSEIRVDDWLPFTVEWSFCKKYTVVDEELQYLFNKSCEENKHRYHGLTREIKHYDYEPLEGIIELGFQHAKLDSGGYVLVFYNFSNQHYDYMYIEDGTPDDFLKIVLRQILKGIDKMKQKGITAVRLENPVRDDNTNIQGIYFSMQKKSYSFQNITGCLAVYAEWKYCQAFNIPTRFDESTFGDRLAFLEGLKRINFFDV